MIASFHFTYLCITNWIKKNWQLNKMWSSKSNTESVAKYVIVKYAPPFFLTNKLRYKIYNGKFECVIFVFRTRAFHYIHLSTILILSFYLGLYIPSEFFVSFRISCQHFKAQLLFSCELQKSLISSSWTSSQRYHTRMCRKR
jgi:hypothetical protein